MALQPLAPTPGPGIVRRRRRGRRGPGLGGPADRRALDAAWRSPSTGPTGLRELARLRGSGRRSRLPAFGRVPFAVPTGPGIGLMALLGCTLMVVCLVIDGGDRPEAGDDDLDARLVTPVLSWRRVPGFLSLAAGRERLEADLAAVMTRAPASSCLLVHVGDEQVFDRKAATPLIPASTMKLLTGSAALKVLGPEYRFTTTAATTDAPVDGVIEGDLFLVGGGDPVLVTDAYHAAQDGDPPHTSLDDLARAIRKAGVTRVEGDLIADERRYDTVRYGPVGVAILAKGHEAGPMSGVSVNDGFSPWRSWTPAPVPARASAADLVGALQAAGVSVVGNVVSGPAPAGATTVAEVRSPPLRRIVAEMLTNSDNFTAEMLIKELGRVGVDGKGTAVGSTKAGVTVVRAVLEGLALDGLVLGDGSGLSRVDQVSCTTLDAVLADAGPRSALAAGLAVAGQTGTLADRMAGAPTEGRVRAKTGSLSRVHALAGFVEAAPTGRTIRFAFVANGTASDAAGERLQNDLAAALARYPDLPGASDLGPKPVNPAPT